MNLQQKNFIELVKSVIQQDDRIQISENIDWSYILQLAKRHNLLSIIMEGAIKNSLFLEDDNYTKEMMESLALIGAQVKRTSDFLQLLEAFGEAGVNPIVMKGLICRQLYGKLSDHRPSGDEDVLIKTTEYQIAKKVLLDNGYVMNVMEETEEQLERLQEISFYHPDKKLHIELHFNPMGRETSERAKMSEYFKNVFEDFRVVKIQGVCVRTMNHQDHLLFLVLHAFKHFTLGGFGIRQALDILLYQEKYGSDVNLGEMYNILCEFKAGSFWNDLIYIGNQYLGFKLEVFWEPNCPNELLEDVLQCGAFGNETESEIVAGRAVMRATEDYIINKKSDMFIIVWKSIFPSRVYMLDQAPYLQKKPWLLPFAWMKRWGRYIKKSRKHEKNLTIKSFKISQRRMRLLKKYDLA